MKNKNILLDTNAFIYLMRNEKECSNTISLENRQINESNFYDECKNIFSDFKERNKTKC